LVSAFAGTLQFVATARRYIILSMSNAAWVIVLVLLLTVLGSATLLFITVKYYWGDRGKPPVTGEARRLQKQQELKMRAEQIAYRKANPPKPPSPDFFDNRKR
jgi:hypothetical protein